MADEETCPGEGGREWNWGRGGRERERQNIYKFNGLLCSKRMRRDMQRERKTTGKERKMKSTRREKVNGFNTSDLLRLVQNRKNLLL